MIAEPVARAVAALRDAGFLIEPVSALPDTYRVNEGGAATGADLIDLVERLELMDDETEPAISVAEKHLW